MKKRFIIILLFLIIILLVVVVNVNNMQAKNRQIKKYNEDYEFYNKSQLLGTELTSVINKAIDSNIKNNIKKDDDGNFKNNNQSSIHIYVTFINNGETYTMENLEKRGLDKFNHAFGGIYFRCNKVTYHKLTGKIVSMSFESLQK